MVKPFVFFQKGCPRIDILRPWYIQYSPCFDHDLRCPKEADGTYLSNELYKCEYNFVYLNKNDYVCLFCSCYMSHVMQ